MFPACIRELKEGEGRLTVLLNEQGGMIDDCIITNMGDYLSLVINAGHETTDVPHLETHCAAFRGDVKIATRPDDSILALPIPWRRSQMLRSQSGSS